MAKLKVKKMFNTEKEVYLLHIRLVNALLGDILTKKESELVAYFLLEGGINKETKEVIAKKHNISLPSINNMLRSLRLKGIVKDNKIKSVFKLPDTKEIKYLIYSGYREVKGTD